MRRWIARATYALCLVALIVLVIILLLSSRTYPGRYVRPELFREFQALYYLQQGLFVALLFAIAAACASRLRSRRLATVLILVPMTWLAWLFVWGILHARFGLWLSWEYLWELVAIPGGVAAVGLTTGELVLAVVLLVLGALALSLGLERAARAAGAGFTRQVVVGLLLGFLPVHLAVRVYFTHHIAQGQQAVLALDDASPLALRSEYLIPGLRPPRDTLANLANPERTRQYLAWASRAPELTMPRRANILWIVIESLRFDALTEPTMPYLFGVRDAFQVRVDRNHWSGGNATRAGVFTMFSGLAAYHAKSMRLAGVTFPFFRLLAANGYRIRVGKGSYFNYGSLRAFLPPATTVAELGTQPLADGDSMMVDAFLGDYQQRKRDRPAFDVLTFEATHWPYAYSPRHSIFEPAARRLGLSEYLIPEDAAERAHNRYRNGSHFVDAQVARVLERLRQAGQLDSTIVIVTGDHGEEFRERGQLAHAGGMNDFQGRSLLWIRFPGRPVVRLGADRLSTGMDIVPTLLEYVGFNADVLRTQGTSLFESAEPRPMVMLAEQGVYSPQYHALVSETYISRWRDGETRFRFSGVERRDGKPVTGSEWRDEIATWRSAVAAAYELLPDVRLAPRPFQEP